MKRENAINTEELIADGIIDLETAGKINNYYKNKKADKQSKGMVLNIIAGILIALGVIWIIAANWEYMTKEIKIAGCIGTLLILAVLMMNAKRKQRNLEAYSIVYSGVSLASVAIIGQIYNVMPDMESFLLIATIILACLSFYTLSYITEIMFILSAIVFAMLKTDGVIGLTLLIYGFIVPVVALSKSVLFLYLTRENKNRVETVLRNTVLNVLVFAAIVYDIYLSIRIFNSAIMLMPVLFVGYYLCCLLKLTAQKNLIVVISFINWLLLTASFYRGSVLNFDFGGSASLIILFIIYLALLLAVMVYYFAKEFMADFDKINTFMIFSVFLYFVNGFIDWGYFNYIWGLFLLAFAVYNIYFGVSNMEKSNIVLGEVGLVVLIIRYLFEIGDSIMLRGITCIVVAIGILLFNKAIFKKGDRKNEEV